MNKKNGKHEYLGMQELGEKTRGYNFYIKSQDFSHFYRRALQKMHQGNFSECYGARFENVKCHGVVFKCHGGFVASWGEYFVLELVCLVMNSAH